MKRKLTTGFVIAPSSMRNKPSRVSPVNCAVCGLTVRMYQKRVTKQPSFGGFDQIFSGKLLPSNTRLAADGVGFLAVLAGPIAIIHSVLNDTLFDPCHRSSREAAWAPQGSAESAIERIGANRNDIRE